jgi:hypothetical protein
MKKRVFSFIVATIFSIGLCVGFTTPVFGARTPNATISAPATESHFYATALQEFFDGATGHTAAVLVDLDGCGVDEVVAVKSQLGEERRFPTFNNTKTLLLQYLILKVETFPSH